jgi:hypothetical protein
MATATNVCAVSWKSGKRGVFSTFSQALVFFPGRRYFRKFAIQGGDDSAKRAKGHQKPVSRLYGNTNLTILGDYYGG